MPRTRLVLTRFRTIWLSTGIKSNKCVVYFDQLLVAARTQKLVKLLFSAFCNLFWTFQTFFSLRLQDCIDTKFNPLGPFSSNLNCLSKLLDHAFHIFHWTETVILTRTENLDNFLMLGRCPKNTGSKKSWNSQIGSLGLDLWIIQKSDKYFIVSASLFTLRGSKAKKKLPSVRRLASQVISVRPTKKNFPWITYYLIDYLWRLESRRHQH